MLPKLPLNKIVFLVGLLIATISINAQHFVTTTPTKAAYYSKIPYRELLKGKNNYGNWFVASLTAGGLVPMGKTTFNYTTPSGVNSFSSQGLLSGFAAGLEGRFMIRKFVYLKTSMGAFYRTISFKTFSYREVGFSGMVGLGFPICNRIDVELGYAGFANNAQLSNNATGRMNLDIPNYNNGYIGITHHFSNMISMYVNTYFNFKQNDIAVNYSGFYNPIKDYPIDLLIKEAPGTTDYDAQANFLSFEFGLRIVFLKNFFRQVRIGELPTTIPMYIQTTTKKPYR
jgi:hypothetical protein